MTGGIIQEVGPVGVRLHESELKQLPQTQPQELEADLGWGEGVTDPSESSAPVKPSEAWGGTVGLADPAGSAWGSTLPAVPQDQVPGSGCPGSGSGTGPGGPLRPAPCPAPVLCRGP